MLTESHTQLVGAPGAHHHRGWARRALAVHDDHVVAYPGASHQGGAVGLAVGAGAHPGRCGDKARAEPRPTVSRPGDVGDGGGQSTGACGGA